MGSASLLHRGGEINLMQKNSPGSRLQLLLSQPVERGAVVPGVELPHPPLGLCPVHAATAEVGDEDGAPAFDVQDGQPMKLASLY